MRRFALAACLLAVACSPAPAAGPPGMLPAAIVRVVDGDTAVLRVAGRDERVRFIGVDAPEATSRVEPFGRQATQYARRQLPAGRQVWLEVGVEERDRYRRLLAYVWLQVPDEKAGAEAREKMFNARLLRDGYAQQLTVPPNVKYADLFGRIAAEARRARRGLWAVEGG